MNVRKKKNQIKIGVQKREKPALPFQVSMYVPKAVVLG